MKKALITGITGQDGSYLSEFLLSKGYEVHGIKRRSSSFNTARIDHLYQDPHSKDRNFILHYGDLTDSMNITNLIRKIEPDEIYNLGAQSHVGVSFEAPEYTANVDGMGTLRILESIKALNLIDKIRFYQASTSELFGNTSVLPQNESTPFYPRSPYAISKLFAYWMTINYREAYGIYACNGILFNHESPRRGENFVTRKITRGLSRISVGLDDCLYLGNLNAMRDWGHARDFVEMQWLMLQQEIPKDYVIATGEQYSVRDFAIWAGKALGIELEFTGTGKKELGIVIEVIGEAKKYLNKGDVIIKVDPNYYRPTETDNLLGDASLAKNELNWEPRYTAEELCYEMVAEDLKLARLNQSFSKK